MPALKKTRVWPSLNFSLSSLTMSITAWAAALSFLALATAEAPMMLYLALNSGYASLLGKPARQMAIPASTPLQVYWCITRPGSTPPGCLWVLGTTQRMKWGILKNTGRLRWLSRKLDHTAQTPAQEVTKVTDDSLLLFYSEATARHLPIIRFVDTASPLYVFILGTTWSSVISYGAMMAFYIPFIRGLGHSSVVRMDLIPSMEAIAFQKVGFFGSVRTEMVPIKNLTKIKVEHSRYL